MRSKSKQPKKELKSFDAPPLDFANMNIKALSDLKYIKPKQGRRKDILTDREEAKDEVKKKGTSNTNNQLISLQIVANNRMLLKLLSNKTRKRSRSKMVKRRKKKKKERERKKNE